MSNKRIFIFILLLLILTFFVIYESWPIVQSESKIRKDVLKDFPIGTSQADVWVYAQKIDPGIDGAYKDKRSWWKNNDQSTEERIGNSRILASISNIGIVDVTIIWIFDENNKLIEIYAWKTIDLL